MLRAADITLAYGEREVLRDFSLRLKPGELVAVLGVNGSGKSTLLRCLNGILRPRRGTVLLEERALAGMSGGELAKRIGSMPQKANGVACTVFDAVLLGRKPHIGWGSSAHDLRVVTGILHRMGLTEYALRCTSELSGGELQKVLIARALAQEPRVLLLDEPVSHLDLKNQLETMTILHDLTRRLGLLVVAVLHDLSLALRFADRFALLRRGRLFAAGGREVVTAEAIREVYQVDAVIHEVGGVPLVVPLSPGPRA